jgi:hypothetical protein
MCNQIDDTPKVSSGNLRNHQIQVDSIERLADILMSFLAQD